MARRAKHTSKLTRRERECQKIARSKATRKRLHTWWRRGQIILGSIAALIIVSGGIWEYHYAGLSRTIGHVIDTAYATTAKGGFAVQTVILEGRQRTPLVEINQALRIQSGDPILAVSLDDVRMDLETIPTVKFAYVERMLPSTIQITLVERQPVAVWQMNGKLHLIDDEGTVVNDLALRDFPNLPLVVGAGAPQHVKEALKIVESAPELSPRIAALVRIGDRRWDIYLADGPHIKLPEINMPVVWDQFMQQSRSRSLLSQPLRSIDLRLPGRIVLLPMRDAPSDQASGSSV